MRVFELYFNPKESEDIIFDSFCYEPINIEEKKLGNLYMVGELKNVLPQNYKLLEDLSFQIKNEFYRDSKRSSERGLIESLKNGNKFLEHLTKEGNVSWLGNLNFAVLTIKPQTMSPDILRGKDSLFHFTKVENISAFLLRGGKITDIAKNLSQEEIEPYPLKVFGNIVSGKLMENDILLILTKEVSDIFQNERLINEIASLEIFTEKKLKELLEKKEKILKEVSGIALLIAMTKEPLTLKAKIPKLFQFKKAEEKFSFIESFSPIKTLAKKILSPIKLPVLPLLNLTKFQLPKPRKHIFDILPRKFSFPKFGILRKNLILILAFTIILVCGFYIFQFQEKREVAKIEEKLLQIQLNVQNAEKFLILNNKKGAKNLFSGAFEDIEFLEKTIPENNISLKKDILSLKEKIELSLLSLNNLIKITEPEIFFDFSQTPKENLRLPTEQAQFVPQKMVILGQELYFFNPLSQNLFQLDINQKSGKEIQIDKKFNFAQSSTGNSIIFFTKPDTFYHYKNGEFLEYKIQLSGDFDFIDFEKFYSNLYLLDKQQGEILKCVLKTPKENKLPTGQDCQSWILKDASKKLTNAVSFAIDGNIWILTKDGDLDKYYRGAFQETLKLNVFPKLEKPTKISISPNLPYFFILEPIKNRVLIISKSGEILKQFTFSMA